MRDQTPWQKSTKSTPEGNCVEVAVISRAG